MVDSPKPTWFVSGLFGAALGGALGYYAFFWMVRQGFYALILPGTLVGVGFGLLSRRESVTSGILCGVFAVALGVVAEWRVAPFLEDDSFVFFLTHLYQLRPVTMIMIVLGGVFAFWFGRGRQGGKG